ncbi:hypothetical protein [Limoniibacter endophyticus]|uniref:Uncharacterized protein n=1 Tax=Limoniibacter endophyticus TaxID=1565040 RepID=A0A8J3GJP5_9HYPH|nr:hypothetical protein [Limoniibacter endophyticus]GHC79502.1 hypothetical protein GCM10010136_32100 [Limoniibacter endophyticus]
MTKEFMPEHSQMPYGSKYRPLYRLFVGERWRFIIRNKVPVEFDTAHAAREEAKRHLTALLNPQIRSEQMATDESNVLAAEIIGWRERREQEALAERQRVFSAPSKTVFAKGGRQVEVEMRRKRR